MMRLTLNAIPEPQKRMSNYERFVRFVRLLKKRGFYDIFKESLLTTKEVSLLQKKIGNNAIAVFGSSVNPITIRHIALMWKTGPLFKEGFFVPSGAYKEPSVKIDKEGGNHRKKMVRHCEGYLPHNFMVDYRDLNSGQYTPTVELDKDIKEKNLGKKIWQVIGSDCLKSLPTWGGNKEDSRYLQEETNWLIVERHGHPITEEMMPKKSIMLGTSEPDLSSSMVREIRMNKKATRKDRWENLVATEVEDYIRANKLYLPKN